MAIQLEQRIIDLIKEKSTKKVLATVDKTGEVHVVFKGSITYDDQSGKITLFELIDTSKTNQNLTYSIWFDKKVAINILGEDGSSFEIKGIPERYVYSGREFEKKYNEVLTRNPEADLAGIWYIDPTDVREETFLIRNRTEKELHPTVGHIDKDLV